MEWLGEDEETHGLGRVGETDDGRGRLWGGEEGWEAEGGAERR